jgi:hypothetical protein
MDTPQIKKYLARHSVTDPKVAEDLTRELRQLELPGLRLPYRVPASKASGKSIASLRERALILTRLDDPTSLREGFRDGNDTISSIIPKLVSGNVPAFNIVGKQLATPADFAGLTWSLRSPYTEVTKAAFLDARSTVRHSAVLSVGALNEAMLDARMILREIHRISQSVRATQVIISHNHPSGNPNPSSADIALTHRLAEGLGLVGLKLLDHIITNGERYASYRNGWSIARMETEAPSWEAISRDKLPALDAPGKLTPIVRCLRQVNPGCNHVIYVSAALTIIGVERLSQALDFGQLIQRITCGAGREGAYGVMIDLPGTADRKSVAAIENLLSKLHLQLVDIALADIPSFRAAGLMEQATVPEAHRENILSHVLREHRSRAPHRRGISV